MRLGVFFLSRHSHAFSAISIANDNKMGLAKNAPEKSNSSDGGDLDPCSSNSVTTRWNDFAFAIKKAASRFASRLLFFGHEHFSRIHSRCGSQLGEGRERHKIVLFFFNTPSPCHPICHWHSKAETPRQVCCTRSVCRTGFLPDQHCRDTGSCQDTVQLIL